MILTACNWLDRVTRAIAYTAMTLFLALIGCTLFEVIARYGFNAPTIWAFDVTFMVHGALFILTGAYTLQKNAHVRIDVLSTRFPIRSQHGGNLIIYLFLTLPAFGVLSDAAIKRAYSAYMTDEVELMSAWGPLVWPSYTVLSIGLVSLFLQSFVEAVRHVIGMIDGHRAIGEG